VKKGRKERCAPVGRISLYVKCKGVENGGLIRTRSRKTFSVIKEREGSDWGRATQKLARMERSPYLSRGRRGANLVLREKDRVLLEAGEKEKASAKGGNTLTEASSKRNRYPSLFQEKKLHLFPTKRKERGGEQQNRARGVRRGRQFV